MNMRMNYDTIKKHYDLYGDEIKYLVYIHYYPIVEKIYLKNNGEITKNDLEVELKKIIDSYIAEGNRSTNPSKYIQDKMNQYESKYYLDKEKKIGAELINKAYNGDINIRYEIFKTCLNVIDNKAVIIYNNLVNNSINNTYTLDDIKQTLYNDIWLLINRFYDRENRGLKLKTAVSVRLRDLSIRINKYIENNNVEGLKTLKKHLVFSNLEEKLNNNRRN